MKDKEKIENQITEMNNKMNEIYNMCNDATLILSVLCAHVSHLIVTNVKSNNMMIEAGEEFCGIIMKNIRDFKK